MATGTKTTFQDETVAFENITVTGTQTQTGNVTTTGDVTLTGAVTQTDTGGTAYLSTNTSSSTTTARHKFVSQSDGAASTVGDLLGMYGLAYVQSGDTVQAGSSVNGIMGWTDIDATAASLGAGGSVYAAARFILEISSGNLSPTSGRASAIIYAETWNAATGGDIDAGIYILNNMQTANKTIVAGVKIHSGGGVAGNGGFTYGIDMSGANIATAVLNVGDDDTVASHDASNVSGATQGWIKVKVGAQDKYIALYDAVA